MWPFNTGDCLIEVTAWAYFTLYAIKTAKWPYKDLMCVVDRGFECRPESG
jgi:hypothetical protein